MRLLIALALLAACEKRDESPVALPPDPPAKPAAKPKLDIAPEAPENLPPACARYRLLIARLAQCEKMEESVREALRQAFRTVEDAFQQLGSMPPESLKHVDAGCQQGVDALEAIADTMCPDVMKVERE